MRKSDLDYLESIGELKALEEMAAGKHGGQGSSLRSEVDAWLRRKELERNLSNSASAEAMAEEHLRIAKKQTTILIIAMIISAITAISAAVIGGILSYSSPSPLVMLQQLL